MPMLVILVIAWMISGAWKGAKEETKNQGRKGVAALQAMTAKGAQNSEGGRRAATAARGVGHVLKFVGVAALLAWAATKAIGRAAADGARDGRQRGRDDYVNRTDDPHPAADKPWFNPRRCPECGAEFVRGDRDAGQAPWVHPAGSTCPLGPDVVDMEPVTACPRCSRGVIRGDACDSCHQRPNGRPRHGGPGGTCIDCENGLTPGDRCPTCGYVEPQAGSSGGGSPDPNAAGNKPKPTCPGCGIRLRRRMIDDGNGGKVRATVHEDTNRRECAKPDPNSNGRPDSSKPRGDRPRPTRPTCVHADGCGIELIRGGPGQARWVHPAGGVCKYSGENASPLPDPAGANAS